jgi:pimeloyl-ACP methyl ester carboxylesterase
MNGTVAQISAVLRQPLNNQALNLRSENGVFDVHNHSSWQTDREHLPNEETFSAAPETEPLILFSGLAADASVFLPQRLAFSQLIVPAWPKPQSDDTLDSYCDHLAGMIQPGRDAIIGGASFGGIIALHVAQRLRPSAVILIGSVRSPAELPRWVRFCHRLKPLVPLIPVRLLQVCCAPVTYKVARRWFPHLCGLARQFRGSDPIVLKWSLARILDWTTAPDISCPIFHIHGDRDSVLPMRYTIPDVVVKGGGHVISLTHPTEVNAFIRSTIAKTRREPSNALEDRESRFNNENSNFGLR